MIKFFTLAIFLFSAIFASAQTDAKVKAVYTLAQIPAPLGVYNYVVQARIINAGMADLPDLAVALTVTGVNAFTDTQRVSINSGDTLLVNFSPFSPWNLGNNTVTVSVPDDDNNANNSAAYALLVNNNTFSYADNSPAASSTGYGTAAGMLLTHYYISGSGAVKQVKIFISNEPGNVGNTVYGVVVNYGGILAQSDPHVITAAELGSYITLNLPPATNVEYDFFSGLLQTANAVTPYNPLGVQTEETPTRPDAYYAANSAGLNLVPLTFFGRLMIQALVEVGTVSPFNQTINTPNRVLAGWDFSGLNSSITATATRFDTSLSSSGILSRGPGAPVSPGIHSFSTRGFGNTGISTANTSYYQISLSPKAGDVLSLSSLSAALHGSNSLISGSPVTSQVAYSLDGSNYTLIGLPVESNIKTGYFYISLTEIPELQNITAGTTVSFRYYASGEVAASGWGFLSTEPGSYGLAVFGRSVSPNSILTAPVEPSGSPYTLGNCTSAAQGSISFNSTGTFSAVNKYLVQLGAVTEPGSGNYRFNSPITIGAITSSANAGNISFTVPPGTRSGTEYAIRVVSTAPYVEGSFSQPFVINAQNCNSLPRDQFRSKVSGDWANPASWESFDGNNWISATLSPTALASQIEILKENEITISTNVVLTNMHVKGTLKLKNGNGSKGMAGFVSPGFFINTAMTVDTGGVFQINSQELVYNDALLDLGGDLRVQGKASIGNTTDPLAEGFEGLALETTSFIRWFNGAVFDWNSSLVSPRFDTTYFPESYTSPTFRISSIPLETLGGNADLTINALLEINTPVTLAGAGLKTFRDGIKGTSVITQSAGCGEFHTDAEFQDFPATNLSVATQKGILGGSIQIRLAEPGLTLIQGATVPDSAKISITGRTTSLQKFESFAGGKASLTANTILAMENADLVNSGLIEGPGILKFAGDQPSYLTSAGVLTAPVILVNKQLSLGGNSNIADLSLTSVSNLTLAGFNLNMNASILNADSANFIITNDTGRLNRFVASTPVRYPIGINDSSYTPATITNSGEPANIRIRVAEGFPTNIQPVNESVNRTWLIGDSSQAGIDLAVKLQWNAADELPGFTHYNAFISQLTGCADPLICPAGSYDYGSPASAVYDGNLYGIERTGINNFYSPAFIVSSRAAYTFTGNGDWDIPANWTPPVVAPSVISEGIVVSIDPVPNGECLRNGSIKVLPGGQLTVQPGKKLTVTGDLIME